MRVVTITLSVAPGHTKPVTESAVQTLAASPAAPSCQWMLSAEIGEVNTLLVAFAGQPLDVLLEQVGQWLSTLRATADAASLRHIVSDVHETSATAQALARLAIQATGCVLLQVLGAPSTHGVCLTRVTGTQDRHWVFHAVATPDEALAMARRTVEADSVAVADSSLWLPVPLTFLESSRS